MDPRRRPRAAEGWGYGAPPDQAAFLARLEGLVDAVHRSPHVGGSCYTQLADVEQERDGTWTPSGGQFDIELLRSMVRGES